MRLRFAGLSYRNNRVKFFYSDELRLYNVCEYCARFLSLGSRRWTELFWLSSGNFGWLLFLPLSRSRSFALPSFDRYKNCLTWISPIAVHQLDSFLANKTQSFRWLRLAVWKVQFCSTKIGQRFYSWSFEESEIVRNFFIRIHGKSSS